MQLGTAVRVTRSKNDLQSVAAKVSGKSSARSVAVVKVSGKFSNACFGFFHGTLGSKIHAQHNLTQDNWSSTELSDVVSAANVLVTTR